MTSQASPDSPVPTSSPEPALSDVIKIAVLAVGGQGGGVLTNWIADLASRGGFDVQMTSVAGVAQRTGATIYYIEMAPKSGRPPVFAQSPSPGDVDIMIAAELMEAGRAVLRGFVTPDRTTLIASTHRILAVSEKQVPGDGRSDGKLVEKEITDAAFHTVCFDMDKIATNAGSVISSSLFGGLARSGVLPFPTSLYEEVIKASGRGVEQSLAAFRDTLEFDDTKTETEKPNRQQSQVQGPQHLLSQWQALEKRIDTLDPATHAMVDAGLRKVVDYQDTDYGKEYLDHVVEWHAMDDQQHQYELTNAAAKAIANAMCYDDILRVADLKIRRSREQRVRKEQQVDNDAVLQVTEYFHPRAEELAGSMPAAIGNWLHRSPRVFKVFDKLVNRGRRIRTDRLGGFLTLRFIALFKPYRRKLLRHQQETLHLERLLTTAREAANTDYQLAVEILKCQRLVKGYSDTHVRGHSKFDRIIRSVDALDGRSDAADLLRHLREVAMSDEAGTELDTAIATLQSGPGQASQQI